MRSLGDIAVRVVSGLLLLICGLWLGGHPTHLPGPLRDAFVSDDRAVRAQVEGLIKDNYYKKISDSKMQQDSLSGIVDGLHDRFSHYITPQQTKDFNQQLAGQFEGVGMGIQEAKTGLRITKVYDRSPASKAGIEIGETVTTVNGESIAGLSSTVAAGKISGKAGTSVKLGIVGRDGGKARILDVKRAKIQTPIVTGKMVDRGGRKFGVVHLATFSDGAHGLVRQKVDQLLKQGADGIVFDLRENGGGLLSEGVLVSSIFIEHGLVVFTKGRTRPRRNYDAEGDAIDGKVPVVVLVDRNTASAAEIVTGALRDRKRATVVGTRTFGKGVFQEVERLSNGGMLDITVGEYFVPSGENLGHKGITPTVKASDDPKTARDEALPTAIKTLAQKVKSP